MNPVVSVKLVNDRGPDVAKRLLLLTKKQVVVGVPKDASTRKEPRITNAMLAYIHDKGSPLQGIPQREFLRPGILEDKKNISEELKGAGKLALDGKDPMPGLKRAGLEAQKAVRKKINTGPFTPLKPATLAARRRKGFSGTLPLVVTAQLRNSINFAVRDK